jgi:hypothetical protein
MLSLQNCSKKVPRLLLENNEIIPWQTITETCIQRQRCSAGGSRGAECGVRCSVVAMAVIVLSGGGGGRRRASEQRLQKSVP